MSSADEPDESADDGGWIEYVTPGKPAAAVAGALGTVGPDAGDLRLGRRHSSLFGLVIPPIVFLTVGALLWVDIRQFGIRDFAPIGLVLLGWIAAEIATLRCDADVTRGRPSRAVYVADQFAIAALALAVLGELVATLLDGRVGAGNWRRLLFAGLVLGTSLVRLRSRLARARARLGPASVDAFT